MGNVPLLAPPICTDSIPAGVPVAGADLDAVAGAAGTAGAVSAPPRYIST